jgi:enoyl-CoA hydratase/carnithine racemase
VQLETMYSEIDDRVAMVVLNRPQVLNCANEQWARDLNVLLDDVIAHERVRVVVVRGSGRAFCSGIDLTALSRGEISMEFYRNWESGLRKLETMDPIAVAAVHSHCIGGGLQIILACDLRVAREDAHFGITAVREGIIPGIGMWRIARYAGMGRAKQLALIADKVDAKTALQWGLVDWVEGAETFEERIAEVIDRIHTMAWTSTRLTKKLTNAAFDLRFDEFVKTYLDYQEQSMASPEHKAAMAEHRAERAARPGNR